MNQENEAQRRERRRSQPRREPAGSARGKSGAGRPADDGGQGSAGMTEAITWDCSADGAAVERVPEPVQAPARVPASGDALLALLHTIESEIIPRLLVAHQAVPPEPQAGVAGDRRAEPAQQAAVAGQGTRAADVREFARIVSQHDLRVAASFIEALRTRGMPLERIYLELLAPAARLLGEWWEQDVRDFTQVTAALCRMHQLLHQYSSAFGTGAAATPSAPRILLAPLPGEQHTFGLIMVGEFFRREGWDVWDLNPRDIPSLTERLHGQHFDVLGLSVAHASRLAEVPTLIRKARAASRNRTLRVMVGGAPFVADPARALTCGADTLAVDARGAPSAAERLLAAPDGGAT